MSSYGRLSTAFYDLDKPAPPADALQFYLFAIHAAAGPALEAMCGSGRFLIPLMERGVRVDGVDASPHMLGACRSRAVSAGVSPTLYEQSLHELDLPERYGFVFISSGSVGLIEDDGLLVASLRKLHAHMLPGATLLIELVDEEQARFVGSRSGERVVAAEHGSSIRYAFTSRFVEPGGPIEFTSEYQLRSGDEIVDRETEELRLAIRSRETFFSLVASAGFVEVGETADPTGSTWVADGGCILVTATRAGRK